MPWNYSLSSKEKVNKLQLSTAIRYSHYIIFIFILVIMCICSLWFVFLCIDECYREAKD